MIPTTIQEAPPLDSYTPLAEHQQQTPETFHGGRPVLHFHATGARAVGYRAQTSRLPFLKAATQNGEANGDRTPQGISDGEAFDEHANGEVVDDAKVSEVVDIYISTSNLTIYNPVLSTGLSIPYPCISLHAIQTLDPLIDTASRTQVQGIYMQLNFTDPSAQDEEDSEPETLTLTLIPHTLPSGSDATNPHKPAQDVFDALTTCSNLNPTPQLEASGFGDRVVFDGGEENQGMPVLPRGVMLGNADGGLPPPFPGSGGWITSENVAEFFDAEGNWIGWEADEQEPLGGGAGRSRRRSESDDAGVDEDGDEEGNNAEAGKWRRTGD